MSVEWVAVIAIISALLEIGGLIVLGVIMHRMRIKIDGDDALINLQGKRIEEVSREMYRDLIKELSRRDQRG